jgi:hypothetical protein
MKFMHIFEKTLAHLVRLYTEIIFFTEVFT